MKILQIFKNPPDPQTRSMAAILARDQENTEVHLYRQPVDYDQLLELILSHDQVVSWW